MVSIAQAWKQSLIVYTNSLISYSCFAIPLLGSIEVDAVTMAARLCGHCLIHEKLIYIKIYI